MRACRSRSSNPRWLIIRSLPTSLTATASTPERSERGWAGLKVAHATRLA
jgi:hypothetical protein